MKQWVKQICCKLLAELMMMVIIPLLDCVANFPFQSAFYAPPHFHEGPTSKVDFFQH